MSWEHFDDWPGDARGGGAFRGRSEPKVGERTGPTLGERLRLFWHSRPDLPSKRAAKRIVLTPSHVYVQRFDGTEHRVPRGNLRGIRRHHGRMIFGVIDGEDLVLVHRPGCAVQRALIEQLRGETGVWTSSSAVASSVLLGLGACLWSINLFFQYPLPAARQHAHDLWSEIVFGHVASWLLMALAVSLLLWRPSRIRVDGIGVERARGLVPWLPHFVPAESIHSVWVLPLRRKNQTSVHEPYGYEVKLRFARRQRFGSFSSLEMLQVAQMTKGALQVSLREAQSCAQEIARSLGCELMDRSKQPTGFRFGIGDL